MSAASASAVAAKRQAPAPSNGAETPKSGSGAVALPQDRAVRLGGGKSEILLPQDGAVRVARNPDGTISVTREASILHAVPSHLLARAALRQAEMRTRILIEVALLAGRVDALDQEMRRFVGWDKFPAREGGSQPDAGAAACLSRAQGLADFEASVWRHRAQELAHSASDRDREEIQRLLRFDLATSLRDLSEVQTWERSRYALHADAQAKELAVEDYHRGASALQNSSDPWTVDGWRAGGTGGAVVGTNGLFGDSQTTLHNFSVALHQAQAASRVEGERARAEHAITRRELQDALAKCEMLRRHNASQISQLSIELQKSQKERDAALREAADANARTADLRGQLQKVHEENAALRKDSAESHISRELLKGQLQQQQSTLARMVNASYGEPFPPMGGCGLGGLPLSSRAAAALPSVSRPLSARRSSGGWRP